MLILSLFLADKNIEITEGWCQREKVATDFFQYQNEQP